MPRSRGPAQNKLNGIFGAAFVASCFVQIYFFNLTGLSLICVTFPGCMFCGIVSVNMCASNLCVYFVFFGFFSVCLTLFHFILLSQAPVRFLVRESKKGFVFWQMGKLGGSWRLCSRGTIIRMYCIKNLISVKKRKIIK